MDKQTSNKKVMDEKERKVFVVSLPHDISKDDLSKYFSRFGQIEDVRIIKDRGFGFVLFSDRVGYIKVFEEGDFHMIKGKQVSRLLQRSNAGKYYFVKNSRTCKTSLLISQIICTQATIKDNKLTQIS